MPAKIKRIGVSRAVLKVVIPGPPPPPIPSSFPNKRTSGVLEAPKDAKLIDWAVVNGNVGTPHWIRVTVYKCPAGAVKTVIAGPTAVYLSPSFIAHLWVPLTAGCKSDYYEVVIEDDDLN